MSIAGLSFLQCLLQVLSLHCRCLSPCRLGLVLGIMNGIACMISFSACVLCCIGKILNAYMLILCLGTLLKAFVICKSFLWGPQGQCQCRIILSAKKNTMTSSFPIFITSFIPLLFLTALD